jgi:hypothetical protein
MAPIIKREEDEDDSIPSEVLFAPAPPAPAQARAPARMADINQNLLVPLTPEQESEQRFPPGCPVWHSLEYSTSSSSSSTSNQRLPTMEACGGVVRAIYIDLKSREIVYRVESNMSSSTDDEAGEQIFLSEGQLAFASDCRVKARGMLDEDDMEGLEGVILCPIFAPPSNDRNLNDTKKLLYAIRFLLNGDGKPRVMVKFDVDQDLIVYNPSLSLGGDDDDETAGASSRMVEENRDPGKEKESDKRNDSVSNQFSIDASSDNYVSGTLAAQVQQRSSTMACAVIDPDPIDGGSIYSSELIQQSDWNGASEVPSTAAATEKSDHQEDAVDDTKYEKRSSESISLNQEEHISQLNFALTNTALHTGYEQGTNSVADSSLSVSSLAKPCSTIDNALAPDYDQERFFPQRWEPPSRQVTLSSGIPQKQNLSSTMNEGQKKQNITCVLTVPLWVLKKCVRLNSLFGESFLILYEFSSLRLLLQLNTVTCSRYG